MRAEQASREGKLLADSQRSAQAVREEQIQARTRVERVEAEAAEARREAQSARAEQVEARARAERLDAELAAARREAAEAVRRADEAQVSLAKVEERLSHARETIGNYDGEIARLVSETKARDELLERAREALAAREAEVARLDAIRRSLSDELGLARKEQVESAAVNSLRGELSEMKSFLASLDQRSAGPDRATLEALMAQLSQRDSASTADLEKRFSETMGKTLEQIDRTLRSATAKPIDTVVEATDVLVGKIFDDETKMETNLEKLDVDTKTSQRGINSNLERLKALRAAKKPEPAPEPAKREQPEKAPAASADSSRGPGPEEDAVSEEARKRVNASMERLKAVREGTTKNG
jgi:dTMP kinase